MEILLYLFGPHFDAITTASVRPVRAKLYVSWSRNTNTENFATIGTSLVGSTDILQGQSGSAINEADSFIYVDETDNTIRLEYERVLIEPLGGMAKAMADIVLDNTDKRFTPDYDATIGTALKPNRPIKLFIGFEVEGQEKLIPIIEGLTTQPKEDKAKRQVKIAVYDFIQGLNEKPQETTIYIDKRSDEIIADILARAGIGTQNYSLDTGLNTIAFAWFEKGQTAGDRIKQICEAEEAVFYQDESGKLRFENRNKYSEAPHNVVAWTIEADDIIEWSQGDSSQIINRVLVSGAPRSVKGEAEVWRDGIEEELDGGGATTTIWAEFEDPVSGITSPVADTDYKAYTEPDSAGSDVTSDVTITATSFTKAVKLEIKNDNVAGVYMPILKIRGTPATVDYEFREIYEDTSSVSDYNEQQKVISNPYIDSRSFAASMAENIVKRHKDPQSELKLKIRGIPQLQLRDQVKVKDQDLDTYTNYRVIRIQGVYEAGKFTQNLTLRKITSNEAL